MKLVQYMMFGAEPVTVRTFTNRETQPHNPTEWHQSLNGQWEIAQAQRRLAADVKANNEQAEPVI